MKPDFLVDMRSEKMSLARLVTWTISSNRAYIVPLPAIYRIAMMTTDHQYLTVVDSPAKQERFMTLKAANGNRSQFVFHGSPIQNWHSILHNGLVVASGTQKQINGAAYGTGIYLCTDPTYSYRYSIGHSVTPPAPMKCEEECCTKTGAVRYARDARIVLSICEVVDNPTVLKKHHGIWVLTDSDYVCVRLLFVYLNATAAAGPTVQGIDAQGMQSIRSAIELFGGDDFDAKMRLLYGTGTETEEGEDEPGAAKRVKKQ